METREYSQQEQAIKKKNKEQAIPQGVRTTDYSRWYELECPRENSKGKDRKTA